MKKLFFASILVFAFCFCALAQTNERSSCPTVKIITPAGLTVEGMKLTFTVSVSGHELEKLKYNWKFSQNIQIEGQGTPVIYFTTTEEMNGLDLITTVEVEGLPKDCINKKSESYQILFNPGSPLILDEYEELPLSEERISLGNVAVQLKEQYKDDTAVFTIYFRDKDSRQTIKNRIFRISNYFSEKHKLPKERFYFVLGETNEYRTRITLMPARANLGDRNWLEQLDKLKPQKQLQKKSVGRN